MGALFRVRSPSERAPTAVGRAERWGASGAVERSPVVRRARAVRWRLAHTVRIVGHVERDSDAVAPAWWLAVNRCDAG